MHVQLMLTALVTLRKGLLAVHIVVSCYLAAVNLHRVPVWADKVQLVVVDA